MGAIHIWVKKIDREYLEAHFDELVARLYPKRREKIARFTRREPAYASMVAGAMLQEIAGRELGILPEDLTVAQMEGGKPYLPDKEEPETVLSVGGKPFHFNISHAGDYVALAYGDIPVGIDIERLRNHDLKVANRCYTEAEQAYVREGTDIARRFFQIWTMKEAYLKLTGQGIRVPLNSFEVVPKELLVKGTSCRFVTREISDYFLSVCFEGEAEIFFLDRDSRIE